MVASIGLVWAIKNLVKLNQRIKMEKKMADYPIEFHTTNNKLQMTARSLELIYKVPNWPPGARSLSMSLKDSGKSRADLWQLAGNVGLEEAIKESTEHGDIEVSP